MENEQIEQSKVAGDPPQQDVAASSRRRLLRASLKAAPVVVATLASRQSLACACVVPSAWGSINAAMGGIDQNVHGIDPNLKGSLARFQRATVDFGFAYTIRNVATSNDAWNAIAKKITNYPNGLLAGLGDYRQKLARKVLYLKGKYSTDTIAVLSAEGLCGKLGGCQPPQVSGKSNPSIDLIVAGSAAGLGSIDENRFAAAILVAQINNYLRFIPAVCMKSAGMINDMAYGTYRPEGISQTWYKDQIADYLHYNWLARIS